MEKGNLADLLKSEDFWKGVGVASLIALPIAGYLGYKNFNSKKPAKNRGQNLNLEFVIDGDYLIYHTLTLSGGRGVSSQEHIEDINNLIAKAIEIAPDAYVDLMKLSGNHGAYPIEYIMDNKNLVPDNVLNLVEKLRQTKEFETIKSQVIQYANEVEKEWDSNYSRSTKLMKKLSGLDIGGNYRVFVHHPSLRGGMNLGFNRIAWGSSMGFQSQGDSLKNYSTVYLWHEIMHDYLGVLSESDVSHDISHAIIQFLTDHELRTRLNKDGGYPPFEGQGKLVHLMESMYKDWQRYLKSPKKDILAFESKMIRKYS